MAKDQQLAVVVNASGGKASREGDALEGRLIAAFAAHGVTAEPHLVEGKALAQTIADVRSAPVVAVGGGDGTLGSAAALLSKSGQVMAVLPLGTLNHLSIDLGIPADLSEAAGVAVDGKVQAIDLAEWESTQKLCLVPSAYLPNLLAKYDDKLHHLQLQKRQHRDVNSRN